MAYLSRRVGYLVSSARLSTTGRVVFVDPSILFDCCKDQFVNCEKGAFMIEK